jgi:hypothetical protein
VNIVEIGLKFWRKRNRLAFVVAAVYWFAVAASYFWALIVRDHDEFGVIGIPFMVLSAPWSVFFFEITNQISNHDLGEATFAISCWLCSGINAYVLYVVVEGASSLLRPFGSKE